MWAMAPGAAAWTPSVVQLPVEGAQLPQAVQWLSLSLTLLHLTLIWHLLGKVEIQTNKSSVNLSGSPLLSFTFITIMPRLGIGCKAAGWWWRQQLRTWATLPGSLLRESIPVFDNVHLAGWQSDTQSISQSVLIFQQVNIWKTKFCLVMTSSIS